jgi:hypothetical protein
MKEAARDELLDESPQACSRPNGRESTNWGVAWQFRAAVCKTASESPVLAGEQQPTRCRA